MVKEYEIYLLIYHGLFSASGGNIVEVIITLCQNAKVTAMRVLLCKSFEQ